MQEFRQKQGRTGERYWQIWFEAPPGQPVETVGTAWGAITDGKHTEHGKTKDRPGDKGKKGTKAYMTAAENAAFVYDRSIRKKMEEGYREVGLDGRPMVGGKTPVGMHVEEGIDHTMGLPKNLCFSKPRNRLSDERIKRLEEDNDLLFTRKVNGMMVIAHVMHSGLVSLYSRRMDTLTYHFPHLVRALGPTGMGFPPDTILLFEAFLNEGNDRRDLLEVQSVMRSKAQRATELQEAKGPMHFYLFRIPVWKSVELEKQNTCEEQAYLIENTLADRFIDWRDEHKPWSKIQFLHPIEIFEGSVVEALAMAEDQGYEGWVCYQRSAVMGKYSYGFHGKPDRPDCCFKLKVFQEDDFIAYFDPGGATKQRPMGSFGSGKNSNRVGTLSLYQLDPKGIEFYICEVGSGLSDEQRDSLLESDYPIVVQVKFEERFYVLEGDKSNALSLPSVIGIRDDKDPRECVNDQL